MDDFVQVAGRPVHYVAEGWGPALVLVHGLLGWSFSWRRNIGAFSKHFRVYALDLPGCGLSGPGLLSAGEAAAFIAGFIAAVGETRAHLLGTSLGGLSALRCAAAHPEMVDRLVLVAPVNPFSDYGRGGIRLGRTVAGEILLAAAQLAGPRLAGYLLRRRYYAHPERVTPETIEGYARPLARRGLPSQLRRVFRAWDVALPEPFPRIPMLLVWGERDRQVPAESGRALARALGARLEVIPGCAHLVYEEEPEAFNRAVLRFLTH